MTRAPFESCRLGELKYAISPGYDARLKNKSIRKCKKMILHDERTWSLYCGRVQTGSDRFGQVRTGVKRYFSSTASRTLSKFGPPQICVQFSNRASLETLPPSEVVETALCHASIGVRCELVWSTTFCRCTTKCNTSLESSLLAKFECEISPG